MTNSHHTRCPACASEDVYGSQPVRTGQSSYCRPSSGPAPSPPYEAQTSEAELEPERLVLLTEEQWLLEEATRLSLTPSDTAGAHTDRIRAFHGPSSPAHTGRLPRPPADRRQDRLRLAACAACEHDDVRVILRTPHLLYLRCYACTHLWTVPKPGLTGTNMPTQGAAQAGG
jgi:hypothetical protein